jgi:hypothetical protein
MALRFPRSLVFLGSFLMSPILFAQTTQVSGIVSDPSKAAVPGSSVEIVNQQTHETISTKTNDTGLYTAPALKPGIYRITVLAPGFTTEVVDNATVAVAAKITLDFTLRPGGVNQTVTVDGSGLELNTTDATVSAVIDRQFVSNIPLNGRSFQSLLTAVPGVSVVPSTGNGESGEFTVNGQRTESNYFTVDGVAANTGASPEGIGFGGGSAERPPTKPCWEPRRVSCR